MGNSDSDLIKLTGKGGGYPVGRDRPQGAVASRPAMRSGLLSVKVQREILHPVQDKLGPSSILDSYRISGTKSPDPQWLQSWQKTLIEHIRARYDLHWYTDDVIRFFQYLNTTAGADFLSTAIDSRSVEFVDTEVEYVHRWTTPYRKGIIAKLYQLEEWYNNLDNPSFTMLSLTVYHDTEYAKNAIGRGYTIPEAFKVLVDNSAKIRNLLKRYAQLEGDRSPNYVWIVEPQLKTDSGYPHRHWLLFKELTENRQEQIRRLWQKRYQAGEQLDFTVSTPGEAIRGLRNYLMKYLGKSFTTTGSKFGDTHWSPAESVFNALVWKHGYRLFGASQELSKVMAWKRQGHCPELEYFTTQLKVSGQGDPVTIWIRPGYEDIAERLQRGEISSTRGTLSTGHTGE